MLDKAWWEEPQRTVLTCLVAFLVAFFFFLAFRFDTHTGTAPATRVFQTTEGTLSCERVTGGTTQRPHIQYLCNPPVGPGVPGANSGT